VIERLLRDQDDQEPIGIGEIGSTPHLPQAVLDQTVETHVLAKVGGLELVEDQRGRITLALGAGLGDDTVEGLDRRLFASEFIAARRQDHVRQGRMGVGEVVIEDVAELERSGQRLGKGGLAPLAVALDVECADAVGWGVKQTAHLESRSRRWTRTRAGSVFR
jgi:hypothetical protein